MSPLVLLLVAALTYGSRAAALVFLPRPGGRFERVLARMPAPIFASLAALAMVTGDRSLAGGPVLGAALGALALSPKRSLAFCLLGGVAGYALAALFF
jgi:hypothetical protein